MGLIPPRKHYFSLQFCLQVVVVVVFFNEMTRPSQPSLNN